MSASGFANRRALVLLATIAIAGCVSAAEQQQRQQAQLRCLMAGVDSTDPDRREASVEDIGKLGALGAEAVPALARALTYDRGDQELRRMVLDALGDIGEPAAEAVPAILRATEHDAALVPAAEQALRKIGPRGEAAIITRLREHSDWRLRRQAARLLYGGQGATADAALLGALANDRQGEVRQAAAQTLGERRVATVAPELAKALEDPHWGTAIAAAHALKRLGADGEKRLRASLLHGNPVASLAAAFALDRYDPRALPQWQKGLVNADPAVREAAVTAITKLGSDAVLRVSPVLKELLTDPAENVQQAAEEALARIETF